MPYAGLKFELDDKVRERISATLGQVLLEQNPHVNPVTVVRIAGRMFDHLEGLMIIDGIATVKE